MPQPLLLQEKEAPFITANLRSVPILAVLIHSLERLPLKLGLIYSSRFAMPAGM